LALGYPATICVCYSYACCFKLFQ